MKKIFLGIDIGKNECWVSFINLEKKEIRKRFAFKNNHFGFNTLKEELDILSYDYNFTYEEVIVAFESTGHYWRNLYYFLNKIGIEAVMVKNESVEAQRQLNYRGKGKNDSIDSHIIALCVKEGYYFKIRENDKDLMALKRMTRCRDDYSSSLTRTKNRLTAWVDTNNPLYFMVFNKISDKTGLAILKAFPTPRDIISMEFIEVIGEVKKHNKHANSKLVQEYVDMVRTFGENVIEPTFGEIQEIHCYLREFDRLEEEKNNLDEAIIKVAKRSIPVYSSIEKIKGIAIIPVISILAEMGIVENFINSRAMQAYMGLTIRGISSGNKKSETKINKAGNRKVRKHLYNIAMLLITHNEAFRKIYCYYKSYNREKPKKNKEMLIAVACKFLRVLYGMMKNNTEFNEKELLKGYDLNNCDIEKFKEEYENKSKKIDNEEELWDFFIGSSVEKVAEIVVEKNFL